MYEYESLYPDLSKKATYFGVELLHAAIIAATLGLSVMVGLTTGNWLLLGIGIFHYAMMVNVDGRTRFYDIRTRLRFFAGQQEFKW